MSLARPKTVVGISDQRLGKVCLRKELCAVLQTDTHLEAPAGGGGGGVVLFIGFDAKY